MNLWRLMGIKPATLKALPQGLPIYLRNLSQLKKGLRGSNDFPIAKFTPYFFQERFESGGSASGHYFHQDLLVARRIFENRPERHLDVGSRVDGFVAHVAVFRQIEVFDIRPLTSTTPNLIFRQLDLMNPGDDWIQSCDSLSCLHALEHMGLGRYGDPVDARGHEKALRHLTSFLRSGGTFYLSVPIGPQRIIFDANRVFAPRTIMNLVEKDFDLRRFSLVDDQGDLHENVPWDPSEVARHFGCQEGCGIWELIRK
ncbi:MAG: DUF268 domain-containing protein [Verrucomicrobiia bacterium]